MGSGFFIRAEGDPAGLDLSMDGKALARNENQLSSFCEEHGVPELLGFVSPSEDQQRAAAETFGIELLVLAPEQWFPAADGLRTIRALQGVVSRQPEWFQGADALLEDLRRTEEILVSLDQLGIRWHFDVDF